MSFYFFLLILLDAVLIGILFWHIRRGNPAETLLDEISDEGLAIKDMYKTISSELKETQAKGNKTLRKLQQMMSELEQEVEDHQAKLKETVKSAAEDLSARVEEAMQLAPLNVDTIQHLHEQGQAQAQRLKKLVLRAESISMHLQGQANTAHSAFRPQREELYRDIRELLRSGKSPVDIRDELGVSEAEISLVERIAYP